MSSKWPGRSPQGYVLLRAFMRSGDDASVGDSDAELVAAATEALRPLLGIRGEPERAWVRRWADGMPQYKVDHTEWLDSVDRELAAHPGLFLCGASYRGIGVPDCIRQGRDAAERHPRVRAPRGRTEPRADHERLNQEDDEERSGQVSKLKAVLLMAYGTPEILSDVEPYYRDILGGRDPRPEAVAELTERYRAVGGRTPLLEITQSVASLLEERLNRDDGDASWRVYVGMKHWHPYIAEAVERIVADGVDELIALPMAPHYSRMSIAGYREAVARSMEQAASPPGAGFIESWHANPLFTAFIAQRIRDGLVGFDAPPSDVEVLFTAHSLPTRIMDGGRPVSV